MHLEGAGSRVNSLNQMDLLRLQNLQNGIRNPSASLGSGLMDLQQTSYLQQGMMDLQQASHLQQAPVSQGSGQFQMNGSAMLLGTVAALQEESGHLRSQWKSDVSRLERELDHLRAAAAYALPQLSEVQRQPEPNLQALVLAGLGGAGPLQQALALQGGARERCLPVLQMAGRPGSFGPEAGGACDRDQLLDCIAVLESQRKNLELQRDQALSAQMRIGSAASDCSGAAVTPRSAAERQLRMEALLTPSMSVSAAPTPRLPTRAPPDLSPSPAAPASDEVYKELERMEIELRKVRDENSKLKEEKAACEEAHSRDVSTLEAMLSQMMNDNERLKKALGGAEALLRTKNPVGSLDNACWQPQSKDGSLDKTNEGSDHSVRSIRSVMEPAIEPIPLTPRGGYPR